MAKIFNFGQFRNYVGQSQKEAAAKTASYGYKWLKRQTGKGLNIAFMKLN